MKIGDSKTHEGQTYWLVPESKDGGCLGCAFTRDNFRDCDRPHAKELPLFTCTETGRGDDRGVFTTDEAIGLTYRLIRS